MRANVGKRVCALTLLPPRPIFLAIQQPASGQVHPLLRKTWRGAIREAPLSGHDMALTLSHVCVRSRSRLMLPCVRSKAPCVDIIDRATSIVDYDRREEKQKFICDPSMQPRCCPVLRELYGREKSKSEPCPDVFVERHTCNVISPFHGASA